MVSFVYSVYNTVSDPQKMLTENLLMNKYPGINIKSKVNSLQQQTLVWSLGVRQVLLYFHFRDEETEYREVIWIVPTQERVEVGAGIKTQM